MEEVFPSHVVNKWIGNGRRVAEKHYLQVTEDHFRKATSGAPGGALHMRSSDAPQTAANEKSDAAKPAKNRGVPQYVARGVGDTGLEHGAETLEKAQSVAGRSIFVATDDGADPVSAWLNACPVALPDSVRADIIQAIDSPGLYSPPSPPLGSIPE